MSYLPIEESEELLTEYGRAFALINAVESSLDLLLKIKYNLYKSNTIINKFLNEIMMGKKISIIKELHLIPETLVKDLYKLNDFRILLAHGITSERMLMKDINKSTRKLFIKHKNKEELLNNEFFNKIIVLSRSILDRLRKEFTKDLVLKK